MISASEAINNNLGIPASVQPRTNRSGKNSRAKIGGRRSKESPAVVLTPFEDSRRLELDNTIAANLQYGKFFIVAAALSCLNEERLFLPDTSIYTYAKARFGFNRRTTNTYLCAANVYQSLVEDKTLPIPSSVSHVRSLYQFSPAVRRDIWRRLANSGEPITEENVLSMTVQYQSGLRFSKINNEVYVPSFILDLGHQMLGGRHFDLDPCSTYHANNLHRHEIAKEFFNEVQDGLKMKWKGDVWCFPPLSESNSEASQEWFVAAEWKYLSNEITSCLMLLKVDCHSSWFSRVFCYPHIFINHKLKFLTPSGKEKSFGDAGFVLVYLGAEVQKFCETFEGIGNIPGFNTWAYQIESTTIEDIIQTSGAVDPDSNQKELFLENILSDSNIATVQPQNFETNNIFTPNFNGQLSNNDRGRIDIVRPKCSRARLNQIPYTSSLNNPSVRQVPQPLYPFNNINKPAAFEYMPQLMNPQL